MSSFFNIYESTKFKTDLKCKVGLCFTIGLSGIGQKGETIPKFDADLTKTYLCPKIYNS
jgi:hypothetical protein